MEDALNTIQNEAIKHGELHRFEKRKDNKKTILAKRKAQQDDYKKYA